MIDVSFKRQKQWVVSLRVQTVHEEKPIIHSEV